MSRNLNVLNINDKAIGFLSDPELQKWLEIVDVGTVDSVQLRILEAPVSHIDIFLIDVDMSGTEHPKGLVWGSETFRLYGPLLAVPFLSGAELSTFTPYSSFWGKADVQKNGFLLVALSLILSKVERRTFTLSQTRDYVTSRAGPTSTNPDLAPKEALATGIAGYRKAIEEFEDLEFIDLDRTIDRLAALERESQSPLSAPFLDGEGCIDVAYCYPPGIETSISLSSLFADMLNFKEPVSVDRLAPVYRTLEAWKRIRGTKVRLGNALFDSVVAALDQCASTNNKISHVMQEIPVLNQGKVSKKRFSRLAMLFAWVRAWRDRSSNQGKLKEAVHARLCLPKRQAGTEYRRLLCPDQMTIEQAADSDPECRPFRKNFDGRNAAYSLDVLVDQDDVYDGNLTPEEKCLCVRYAREVLAWDPVTNASSPPFPLWMK